MFREIRRKERALCAEKATEILTSRNYGVLSVSGDNGYPYGVPVNYAYADGKIYFHSTAASCHKLDAIRREPKVCFTVIAKHELIAKDYATDFASVIVFGKARILTEPGEKKRVMAQMMSMLAPEMKAQAMTCCGNSSYVMVEITPEHITGKAYK